MPLNTRLIGKRYEEISFTVERERVTQFLDAIGEDSPVFRRSDLAPPTFPTVMQIMTSGQIVLDRELGLDYSRVVHGEQEYEYRRPLRAGDALSATPRIADIYSKGPNEFLVTEFEAKDARGETVVVGRSTLISRGTAGT